VNPGQGSYSGTADAIVKIFKFEGLAGFYKGIIPNILRVLPATCITFVAYESISAWFKRNKTFLT